MIEECFSLGNKLVTCEVSTVLLTRRVNKTWYTDSLVPRPRPAFRCLQYRKRKEPGIFSHVSGVTTNEKLINVGGLNDNSFFFAHALVPLKTVREFVCFMPSNRAFDFHAKCTFCQWQKTEKHKRIARVSASLPFCCTLYFVLSQRGCFKSHVCFVMLVSDALPC